MARAHHYQLAHYAFRGFCESSPLGFFGIMASEDRDDFVQRIWSRVCENCDQRETADFGIEELSILTTRIADMPAIVIEMPEAVQVTEAIFIAIVLTTKHADGPSEKEATFRYFTLEVGQTFDGNDRTVLCEWRGETHANMGDGPEATLREFVETVEAKVATKH